MATARLVGDDDNGYTAPPEWWAAIPDSITVTVEQIEAIFYNMGLRPIDAQSFIASATGQSRAPH